jgi:nucleoid-associated protein YgaU
VTTPDFRYTTVKAGDRLDLISIRVYGTKTKYRLLILANPSLDVFRPQPGKTIKVPNA